MSDLAKRLDAGFTSVQHHVRRLVADGIVSIVRADGHRRLIEAKTRRGKRSASVHAAHPLSSGILRVMANKGPHRITSLVRTLGHSRKQVARRLRHLEDAGLVRRSEHYHPTYALTSLGQHALRDIGRAGPLARPGPR